MCNQIVTRLTNALFFVVVLYFCFSSCDMFLDIVFRISDLYTFKRLHIGKYRVESKPNCPFGEERDAVA